MATKEKEIKQNKAKVAAFDELIARMNKEIKSDIGVTLAKLGARPLDVETIPTGSLVLDSIAGGGLAKGRMIEIYGPEASGKTSIALTAAANVQREGGNVVFVDLEQALDPNYAKKLGVDIENLAVAQPEYAEKALQLVYELASSGVVDLIIVDSIAAMVPLAELEGKMEQQTIGLLARVMSKALRKLIAPANQTKTTIIFINQTRDAIGQFSPFGTPTTTTGGKAMKFYASQRIEVKRVGQVKDGKDVIGNEVRLTIKKSKISPPFGVGTTVLTYNEGINRAAEMVEVGPDYGIIEKPNSRTYVEASTGEVIAKSKAEALERIKTDKELYERLSKHLSEIIKERLFDNEKKATREEENEDVETDEEFDDSFEDLGNEE